MNLVVGATGILGSEFCRRLRERGLPVAWCAPARLSVADVAEHAVRSPDDQRLLNRSVPLGGPEALSPNTVVAIFERVSGRSFRTRHIPPALLAMMSPVVALFNEGVASGKSMGA